MRIGVQYGTHRSMVDYDKINQGDKAMIDSANLGGKLSMEVNGERIPLVAAFEPKDVPVLKLGGALPQYKALHAG